MICSATLHYRSIVVFLDRQYSGGAVAQASPSIGSTVSETPHEVTLTFTERLEAAFSNLKVMDARGGEVSEGKTQVNDNTMRINLRPLNAGIYKVNWRAVSTDTHKIEGSFTFRVDGQ